MSIGQLTKLNTSNLLAAGTRAVAKISIPKSSRQINTDSLKWLDKLGSSISKHITSSIESGKLFELAALGANIFGMPAFSERGETHRPVLNFEPGHDQDLNLASVDMQTPTGKLHRWASAPNAATPATPPASSDHAYGNGAPHLLPQRPPIGWTLTSMGVAQGNLHQAKINGHVVGTRPPLPPRNVAVKLGEIQAGRASAMSPLPPQSSQLPPTPSATPPMSPSRQQQSGKASGASEGPRRTSLDEIERSLVGPSFGGPTTASLAQQNIQSRTSEPSVPPLPPKPMALGQNAPSFPSQSSPGGVKTGIPDSLRPGLGRRIQSNLMNGNFNAAPKPVSADVPDSLRPGPHQRRASEPANAIEARSRLAAAMVLSAAQRPTAVRSSNTGSVRFTNVQPMQQIYKGEETGKVFGTQVKYLNERERAAFKVTIKDGKVYDAAGKLFDTRQAFTAFAQNKGRAIFVMAATGAMYVSNEQTRGKFHHTSFFGGAPVAAAGDVRIENGVMTAISRKSGHYRPTSAQLNQAVNHLKNQGISGVFVDEDLS